MGPVDIAPPLMRSCKDRDEVWYLPRQSRELDAPSQAESSNVLSSCHGIRCTRPGKPVGRLSRQDRRARAAPPGVIVTRPVSAPVRNYFEYNGYLDTTETVEVRARVKGLLTGIHYTEGTEVAKGDPLYDIDQREYITAEKKALAELGKAKADVLNWTAQIKLAEAELERARTASKSGVGAKTDLDKAIAQLDVNKAEKMAADASTEAADAALHTANPTGLYANLRRDRRTDQPNARHDRQPRRPVRSNVAHHDRSDG